MENKKEQEVFGGKSGSSETKLNKVAASVKEYFKSWKELLDLIVECLTSSWVAPVTFITTITLCVVGSIVNTPLHSANSAEHGIQEMQLEDKGSQSPQSPTVTVNSNITVEEGTQVTVNTTVNVD